MTKIDNYCKMKEIILELKKIFEEAKNKSEFEYILTLINYRGVGTREEMTNLYEWFEAIDFYKKLYLELEGKEKARIGLLLYCTFFENSDFYNILGSLGKICLGYRGSSYLYFKTKKYEKLLGIGQKKKLILEVLNDSEKHQLIKFFNENHFDVIRNSFFHSAYTIIDNEYIIKDSDPIYINGIGYTHFDIDTFLFPKINNIIIFFEEFKRLYLSSFMSYKENKIVNGFFEKPIQAEILGSSEGLKGFKIRNTTEFFGEKSDCGIFYDEKIGVWTAENIQFDFPNVETIDIKNKLTIYESKDNIKVSNEEFENLIDKITERKILNEVNRAILLLVKFGEFENQKRLKEQNNNLIKVHNKNTLFYLKKAIKLDSSERMVKVKNLINELEKES